MIDNDTARTKLNRGLDMLKTESAQEAFEYDCYIATPVRNYYAKDLRDDDTTHIQFLGVWANINNGVYPAPCELELFTPFVVENRRGIIFTRSEPVTK